MPVLDTLASRIIKNPTQVYTLISNANQYKNRYQIINDLNSLGLDASVILPFIEENGIGNLSEFLKQNYGDDFKLSAKLKLKLKQYGNALQTAADKNKVSFARDELRKEVLKNAALVNVLAGLGSLIKEGVLSSDYITDYEPREEVMSDQSDSVSHLEKTASYKEDEYARRYLETGDKTYKDKALKELKPIIMQQVHKVNNSGALSRGALYAKALGLAAKAVDTWDPSKSKLSTYVTNSLKKLHRTVYQYAPMLKIPENRIGQWADLQRAFEIYEHEHGTESYDPKVIAKMTKLPVSDVEKAIKERRKVYNDSELGTTNIPWSSRYSEINFNLLKEEFTGDQRKVFDAMVKSIERDPNKNVSDVELARKTGLPYSKVNKLHKEIDNKVKEVMSYTM